MIITRTPLRVSLLGGGTDFPGYFDKFTANILTTAIDKYIYISINRNVLGNSTKLSYSKIENTFDIAAIEHPVIRLLFQKYDINNVDMHVSSDVPAGTGLGSSSSFTVGLIKTIHAYLGLKKSNEEILEEAIEIEFANKLEILGLQDFIPPIYGGVIHVCLSKSVRVIDNKFDSSEVEDTLKNRSCLVPVGKPRQASSIIDDFNRNIGSNLDNLHKINEISTSIIRNLKNSEPFDLEKGLNDSWEVKKLTLNQNKNKTVFQYEEDLKSFGVKSLKLCGAGESGYFLCIFSKHEFLNFFLTKFPNSIRFNVDRVGSSLIYDSNDLLSN
jgi:D-glycero-alpha-D-manno-heptose-7-phosphate kinase